MNIWVILGLFLVLTPPVVYSLMICAPKWWRQKVRPKVRNALDSLDSYGVDIPTFRAPAWMEQVKRVAFWVWIGLLSPAFLALFLIALWIDMWRHIITGACPYTHRKVVDRPLVFTKDADLGAAIKCSIKRL